ncbi:MAG: SGNH/GDSL hydrolase family protein [bacterium]
MRPAWVDEVNATVRAVGAATGTNVVDVATALRSPLYVEVDGFHPNALGHRRIAALVSRAIGAQAQ